MTENLTSAQLFDMIGGLVEVGTNFAEQLSTDAQKEVPMDNLFDSAESPVQRKPKYRRTEPGSRRNDVGVYESDYYSRPSYQQSPGQRSQQSPQGDPYNYGYGYVSDKVPTYNQRPSSSSMYGSGYNSTAGYGGSRRTSTGNGMSYSNNGTTSASYGMGNSSTGGYGDGYYQQPQQQDSYQYQSSGIPYDERNYRFPDIDFGLGGGYRR